jgi:hypothetical protein
MKLSELKPCAECHGVMIPVFYRVTVEQGIIDEVQARRFMATAQMLHNSLEMAEAMYGSEGIIKFMPPETILLCQNCAAERGLIK